MIIGIDIGSTITKAVSVEAGRVVLKVKTRALDAVSSGMGAFGKLVLENGVTMGDIERVMITGVGAEQIEGDIYGIPTKKVEEFEAIGTGGMFQVGGGNVPGESGIVIANIGTGTVFIKARRGGITHLGGSGVGGGTILGLGKRLLGLSNFADIMSAAESGDLKQVDLLLGDIVSRSIGVLGMEATAANFGKMLDTASRADIAAAIINMVYQVIGMLAVFAARGAGIGRVIITGSGSDNLIGMRVLDEIAAMYKITFEHPADGQYTTAIGAALSG